MKKLSVLALSALSFGVIASSAAAAATAAPGNQNTHRAAATNFHSTLFIENRAAVQQNLIGEVTAIDQSAGKITVKPDNGNPVSISISDKTLFRRIQPGQTSLANAEQIAVTDIKVGDRVLIPGGAAGDTPVQRVVVIAREALSARDAEQREARRARTFNGRITAVDARKQEIIIQTRGGGGAAGGNAQPLIVSASGNAKLRRYAPDSLKVTDAVAASFTDYRVGDQIRVIGDRSADGSRIAAEEIIAGSVSRMVAIISEINAARGEVTVKNSATGQLMTVSIGKNTTLRRISPEVAELLKQRFERRNERRSQRAANNPNQPGQQTAQEQQTGQPRNRGGERRNRPNNGGNGNDGARPGGNRNPQQLFETLPGITLAELKKGDAVLVTGTTTAADAGQMTAVSIITGDADLQQALQLTQGGRNANLSPGLPGNVSGGNTGGGGDDDEPRR